MTDVRWSDAELRKYVEEESHVSWFADSSEREGERARFRAEARIRIVPVVQSALLERVGLVTDPEGIALVARDLTSDLCCEDHARRWLLVCSEPWEFLADWITKQIVKSYRATARKGIPSAKSLAKILNE